MSETALSTDFYHVQDKTVKISQHKKVSMRNVLMTISSGFQVHLYS